MLQCYSERQLEPAEYGSGVFQDYQGLATRFLLIFLLTRRAFCSSYQYNYNSVHQYGTELPDYPELDYPQNVRKGESNLEIWISVGKENKTIRVTGEGKESDNLTTTSPPNNGNINPLYKKYGDVYIYIGRPNLTITSSAPSKKPEEEKKETMKSLVKPRSTTTVNTVATTLSLSPVTKTGKLSSRHVTRSTTTPVLSTDTETDTDTGSGATEQQTESSEHDHTDTVQQKTRDVVPKPVERPEEVKKKSEKGKPQNSVNSGKTTGANIEEEYDYEDDYDEEGVDIEDEEEGSSNVEDNYEEVEVQNVPEAGGRTPAVKGKLGVNHKEFVEYGVENGEKGKGKKGSTGKNKLKSGKTLIGTVHSS